jgi:hypothetical protein
MQFPLLDNLTSIKKIDFNPLVFFSKNIFALLTFHKNSTFCRLGSECWDFFKDPPVNIQNEVLHLIRLSFSCSIMIMLSLSKLHAFNANQIDDLCISLLTPAKCCI